MDEDDNNNLLLGMIDGFMKNAQLQLTNLKGIQEQLAAVKEQTVIIIKPELVKRGYVGKIIDRYEQEGFYLGRMKMPICSEEMAQAHYQEHKDKPFFERLVKQFTGKRIVVIMLAGPAGTIEKVRKMNGATDPAKAEVGTIRRDFGISLEENGIHASDSIESSEREKKLWFPRD